MTGYQVMFVTPYNRPSCEHKHVYQPPRALEAIDADLDAISGRIMKLLAEVHS